MARYIDIDKMNEWQGNPNGCGGTEDCTGFSDCKECYYNNGGAEEVAPVVHSSWRTLYKYSKCNNCGQRSTVQSNFCPNCGAQMDKE